MLKRPRQLGADEVQQLLARDVPARLATLDAEGFPHVTPLWFVWHDGAFYMTSIADRPHLRRVARNPRVGIVVDVEDPQRLDGQRPNRQVRATGVAELLADDGAVWTTRITEKYVREPAASERVQARSRDQRIVIRLRPERLIAVASI
jgi:PPOX class probable F420-dependent enzyme